VKIRVEITDHRYELDAKTIIEEECEGLHDLDSTLEFYKLALKAQGFFVDGYKLELIPEDIEN
jgi:hypothetical protein